MMNNSTVCGVPEYPLRETLTNEIHARPPVPLRVPAQVSHLALLTGEAASDASRHHVAELCRRYHQEEPPPGANCWVVEFDDLRLNWERHIEFSTYTFFRQGPFTEPFQEPVIDRVPCDWLEGLTGEVLVAIHVALESRDAPERSGQDLVGCFTSDYLSGSRMSGNRAVAWSDFRLDEKGFSRFLIRDLNLDEFKAGRLVQRLLEVETYRMMALLAFPLALEYSAEVTRTDQALAELTTRLTQSNDPENEQALLNRLSHQAAEIERIAAATHYRFGAARAYYALVQRRIEELREQRIEGRPTIKEFMERRLAPAMRTCESVQDRLETLSQRVSRAADLLRTRVDVALEQQNRNLLASMNRRARLQLRLQQTVEGLSVIVLSYYSVSLVGYAFKALKSTGLPINADLLTGLSIPVVVGIIWWGIRKLHHSIGSREKASSPGEDVRIPQDPVTHSM